MVQIGKNVRYDDYGRVTIPAQLAELLNLEKGMDEVCWSIEEGKAVIFKVTKSYNGFDFEKDEIKDNLLEYERRYLDESPNEDLSSEEIEARAHEEYQKDQERRAELIKAKRN